jgi:hypothetical protein
MKCKLASKFLSRAIASLGIFISLSSSNAFCADRPVNIQIYGTGQNIESEMLLIPILERVELKAVTSLPAEKVVFQWKLSPEEICSGGSSGDVINFLCYSAADSQLSVIASAGNTVLGRRDLKLRSIMKEPTQPAPSSTDVSSSPPPPTQLSPELQVLFDQAVSDFASCKLQDAALTMEKVVNGSNSSHPESVKLLAEYVDVITSITTLVNEAVAANNSSDYSTSLSKIQEAVDKCPTFDAVLQVQQKLQDNANTHYENQRIAEENARIAEENQRINEENDRIIREQQSQYDTSDVYCDDDGCY